MGFFLGFSLSFLIQMNDLRNCLGFLRFFFAFLEIFLVLALLFKAFLDIMFGKYDVVFTFLL